MPVHLGQHIQVQPSKKSTGAFNNPAKVVIPLSRRAKYNKSDDGIYRFLVLKPVIDTISFTYTIPDNPQEAFGIPYDLAEAFELDATPDSPNLSSELGKALALGFKSWADGNDLVEETSKTGHKYAYRLTHPETGSDIFISALPYIAKSKYFLRLEFNPALLTLKGMQFLKEQLQSALMFEELTWKHIIQKAKITRLDLTVDILGIPTDRLYVTAHKPKQMTTPMKRSLILGEDWAIETIYPRYKRGERPKFTIYDKARQLEHEGKDNPFKGVDWTRVELQLGDTLIGYTPLSEIHKLKTNHFKELGIMAPLNNVQPPEGMHVWELFLDSCCLRGLPKALQRIEDPKLRELYKEAFLAADWHIWEPDELWASVEKSIKDSGLLDGLSP